MELQLCLPAVNGVPVPSVNYYTDNLVPEFKASLTGYNGTGKGKDLSNAHLLRATIFFHAMAIEAEATERYQRADFFWSELKRLYSAHRQLVFDNVFSFRLHANMLDFITWVVTPFHVAFYNNAVVKIEGTTRRRADIHLKAIQDAIGIFKDDRLMKETYIPLVKQQIKHFENQRQWAEVITSCDRLLHHALADGGVWDSWVNAQIANTYFRVNWKGQGVSVHLANASELQEAIKKIVSIKGRPVRLAIFEVLAQLYHQESIQLALGQKYGEALRENYYATTWGGDFEEAEKFRATLLESIQKLQNDIKALEAQIRQNPHAYLTDEGQQMKKEAALAFSLADTLTRSGELKKIAQERVMAEANKLWESIGMKEEDGGMRSMQLYTLMRQMEEHSVSINEAIDKLLITMGPEFPIDRVIDYWTKNEPYVVLENPGETFAPTISSGKSTVSDRPPFKLWWRSSYDRNVKIRFAAALAIFAVAVVLSVFESVKLSQRNKGFEELMTGVEQEDYSKIVHGGRKFFANAPWIMTDARNEMIIERYENGLTRYFLTNRNKLTEEEIHTLY